MTRSFELRFARPSMQQAAVEHHGVARAQQRRDLVGRVARFDDCRERVAARAVAVRARGEGRRPVRIRQVDQRKEKISKRRRRVRRVAGAPTALEERRRVAVPGLIYSTTGEGPDEAEVEQPRPLRPQRSFHQRQQVP